MWFIAKLVFHGLIFIGFLEVAPIACIVAFTLFPEREEWHNLRSWPGFIVMGAAAPALLAFLVWSGMALWHLFFH